MKFWQVAFRFYGLWFLLSNFLILWISIVTGSILLALFIQLVLYPLIYLLNYPFLKRYNYYFLNSGRSLPFLYAKISLADLACIAAFILLIAKPILAICSK